MSSSPIDFEEAIWDALLVAEVEESSVEPLPNRISASTLAHCKRTALTYKIGARDQSPMYGKSRVGMLIHEFLSERLPERLKRLEFDKLLSLKIDGIYVTGRCDAIDSERSAIYDFKTTSGYFGPPDDSYLDQLTIYMAMLPDVADRGRIIYVNRSDLHDVSPWPEDGYFEYDPDRFDDIKQRAKAIRDTLEEHGIPESEEEIPFEKCGCYHCETEQLRFPARASEM